MGDLFPTNWPADVVMESERFRYSHDGGALVMEGPFSDVYRARRESKPGMPATEPCDVAVKVLMKRDMLRLAKVSEVLSESKIHRSVSHENVCQLLETFQDDTHLCFVMELAEGGDLLDLLFEDGAAEQTTGVDVIRFVATEVVRAIEYLHSRGKCCCVPLANPLVCF
jgi:calcium/calmodulin-dependent protein kinase I